MWENKKKSHPSFIFPNTRDDLLDKVQSFTLCSACFIVEIFNLLEVEASFGHKNYGHSSHSSKLMIEFSFAFALPKSWFNSLQVKTMAKNKYIIIE